jgi:transcriptional antiterminator RfaH
VYWCCARLEPNRERLALHCLGLNGFAVYYPRLREQRIRHGRRIEVRPPLFPSYCFVAVELQWHAARWSPGIASLIMNGGGGPARVADSVIDEIRGRERNGAVELPQRGLAPGDRVRVLVGPMRGFAGLYAGMAPRERVIVLLTLLGGQQRVTLARDHVEAI